MHINPSQHNRLSSMVIKVATLLRSIKEKGYYVHQKALKNPIITIIDSKYLVYFRKNQQQRDQDRDRDKDFESLDDGLMILETFGSCKKTIRCCHR